MDREVTSFFPSHVLAISRNGLLCTLKLVKLATSTSSVCIHFAAAHFDLVPLHGSDQII